MGNVTSARTLPTSGDDEKVDHATVMSNLNSTAWEVRLAAARQQREAVLADRAARKLIEQDDPSNTVKDEFNFGLRPKLSLVTDVAPTDPAASARPQSPRAFVSRRERLPEGPSESDDAASPEPAIEPKRQSEPARRRSGASFDRLSAAMRRARTTNQAEKSAPRKMPRSPIIVVGGFALGIIFGFGFAELPDLMRTVETPESAGAARPGISPPDAVLLPSSQSLATEGAPIADQSGPADSAFASGALVEPQSLQTPGLTGGNLAIPTAEQVASAFRFGPGLAEPDLPTEVAPPISPSLVHPATEAAAPDILLSATDTTAVAFKSPTADAPLTRYPADRLPAVGNDLAGSQLPRTHPSVGVLAASGGTYADPPALEPAAPDTSPPIHGVSSPPARLPALSTLPVQPQADAAQPTNHVLPPDLTFATATMQELGVPRSADPMIRLPVAGIGPVSGVVPDTLTQTSPVEIAFSPTDSSSVALARDAESRPVDIRALNAGTTISVFVPNEVSDNDVAQISNLLAGTSLRLADQARVDFGISETNIRYYHREDEAVAVALAKQLNAKARDFTDKTKVPPPGRIELWVAGDGAKAAQVALAPKRQKSRSSSEQVTENLLRQVLRKLKKANSP